MSQVEYHLPELLQVASGNVKAVYAPAILFSASLDQWSVDITNAIAAKCKELNRQGIVVWLRLLFEMVRAEICWLEGLSGKANILLFDLEWRLDGIWSPAHCIYTSMEGGCGCCESANK